MPSRPDGRYRFCEARATPTLTPHSNKIMIMIIIMMTIILIFMIMTIVFVEVAIMKTMMIGRPSKLSEIDLYCGKKTVRISTSPRYRPFALHAIVVLRVVNEKSAQVS